MATDPELGIRVHDWLVQEGIENPVHWSDDAGLIDAAEIHECQHRIMAALRLDMNDESLKDTPARVSKMYCEEIFSGLDYNYFPECKTFPSKNDELVAVSRIEVKSVCEHHFLPFIGTATIGYIPNGKVLGLSKFNRIVDFFSRRPQIQERLVEQIAQALYIVLDCPDIMVVVRAKHMCTIMRGVKSFEAETVTSKIMGRFKEKEALRHEFLSLAG